MQTLFEELARATSNKGLRNRLLFYADTIEFLDVNGLALNVVRDLRKAAQHASKSDNPAHKHGW